MEGFYLGDGAYVRLEHGSLVVYTHNGYEETNRVVLGPDEWYRLTGFVAKIEAEANDAAARGTHAGMEAE